MAEKKSSNLLQSALGLLSLASKIFGLMDLSALIAAEIRLAARSFVYLMVLAVMLALLLTTSWIGLLAIVFIYLTTTLQFSLISAILVILIMNLVLMGGILLSMLKMKKNFSFYGTRQTCKRICRE